MHSMLITEASDQKIGIVHPAFCDRTRCARRGLVVHHCSAPEIFLPRQHDTTEASAVSISIERLDEIDESTGRQVVHPAEMIISDDLGVRVRVGVEDFQELHRIACGLYDADSDSAGRKLAE